MKQLFNFNQNRNMFYLNTTHLKTLSLIGLFTLIMALYLTTCGSTESIAQKGKENKSLPPEPKKYVFVMDSSVYMVVDSILRTSLQVTGYELKASQADGLRNGLAQVIQYFQRERLRQDTITISKPKK